MSEIVRNHLLQKSTELKLRLLAWARQRFAEEVRTKFVQAESFNSLLARIAVDVIRGYTLAEMERLAWLLPLGVGFDNPMSESKRFELELSDRVLVVDFVQRCRHIFRLKDREFADYRSKAFEKRLTDLPECRKRFSNSMKTVAEQWGGHRISDGGDAWAVVAEKAWGRLVVTFILRRDLILSYQLELGNFAKDHYLLALGLGVSEWVVEGPNDWDRIFQTAVQFVEWHFKEYEQILETALIDDGLSLDINSIQ